MKRQSIKEIPLEIDTIYDNIPHPSLLFLTKYSDLKVPFFNIDGNVLWENVTKELFTTCLVNLLITGKIKAIYFKERKSFFFNLIKTTSEGFDIFLSEDRTTTEQEDSLTSSILNSLYTIRHHSTDSYPLAIELTIDNYLGTKPVYRAEKIFFHEYLKYNSKKYDWLRIKEEPKSLGFGADFFVEIDNEKKIELQKYQKKYDWIKFYLRKNNVLFRSFLSYTEDLVRDKFFSKQPSD